MKTIRDSNFELLRIFAMFLVLMVHANFMALGEPTFEDIQVNLVDSIIRVLIQSLCISCVDIFVLITGWYGIKSSKIGFLKFIFQCVFFISVIYMVGIIMGYTHFSISIVKDLLFLSRDYWFVKSYILLYILAPVLNAYIEEASEVLLKRTIIFFYLFQTLYGFVSPESTGFFIGGYSTISFMGLYLLARYIRLYRPSWSTFSKKLDVGIVVAVITCILIIYIAPPVVGGLTSLLWP